MIEMAEEEHFECAVSDLTFRFFDRQYTRMESEKLLYPKPRGRPIGEKNEKMVDHSIRHARNHPA
jgi:hypothetical protein